MNVTKEKKNERIIKCNLCLSLLIKRSLYKLYTQKKTSIC